MAYLLDPEHAQFVGAGRSITLAAAGADRVPMVAKAVAAWVAADRTQVAVVVMRGKAARVLETLAPGAAVAAAFSEPSTHRTIQLKGRVVAVEALPADRVPSIEASMDALTRDLGSIGFSAAYARTLLAFRPDEALAVRFAIDAAFLQTPGPQAGAPIGAAADAGGRREGAR